MGSGPTDLDLLVEELRGAALHDPGSRVTKDVRAWAEARGVVGDAPELLRAYRDATLQEPGALRARIADLVEADGATRIVGLLSMTRLPDAARSLILEALDGKLEGPDFLALARTVSAQRPALLETFVRCAAASTRAEAAFLLSVVLERPEGRDVMERAAAFEMLRGGDGDADAEELAVAAATIELDELVDLRDEVLVRREDVALALEDGLHAVDEDLKLRSADRSANDADKLLRHRLYRACIVLGVPEAGDLASRASEHVFRSDAETSLADTLMAMPLPSMKDYGTRALGRQQLRAGRLERTKAVLDALRRSDREVREPLHGAMFTVFDLEEPDLDACALRALARDAEILDATQRALLAAVFGRLDAQRQGELAGELALVGAADHALDDSGLARWAGAAPEDELRERLAVALGRLRDADPERLESVRPLFEVAHHLVVRVESDQAFRARSDLAAAVAQVLRTAKDRLARPMEMLTSWEPFPQLLLEHLPLFAEVLRAERLRRVVSSLLRAQPGDVPLLEAAAGVAAPDKLVLSVLLPSLSEYLTTGEGLRAARQVRDDAAAPRVCAALLLATGELKRRAFGDTDQSAELEAGVLRQRVARVVAAIERAETEAIGNSALIEQYALLRSALAGLQQPADREAGPETVSWRREQEAKEPQLLATNDECQSVEVTGDLRSDVTATERLLLELDQRAHNARVLAEAERPHAQRDLQVVAKAAARQGVLDDPRFDGLLRRPELGQELAGRWAEQVADVGEETRNLISALAAPRPALALTLKVDALTPRMTAADVASALEPGTEVAPQVLRTLCDLAVNRERGAAGAARDVKLRDTSVMEQIAHRIDAPLRAIEGSLFSYFALRESLADAGWKPVAPSLGARVDAARLDPAKHELRGEDAVADRYVVRSLGIQVGKTPVRRAVVEPLFDGQEEQE